MSNRSMFWRLIAAFALLTGIALGWLWLRPAAAPLQSGMLLETPRPIVDFALTAGDGKSFDKADLIGRWNVIFVGYTHCPDVCPTTLARLEAVKKSLGADAAKVRFVFISIDPERDSPQILDRYTHFFSPDFLSATGPPAQLDRLGASLGFVYAKVAGATPESYLMDHSAELILVDPQAELAGYLTPPFRVERLVDDLRHVLATSR